jgi:hypothetical protein
MANCCHSGGIVESLKEIVGSSVVGPENYSEKIQEWLAKNKTTRPMATCFTACQSNESAYYNHKLRRSYFTYAFEKVLTEKNGPILNIELFNLISKEVFDMRKHVGDKKPQTPGLYCENDRANHTFLEPPPLVIKANTFSNKLVIQCIKISI